jgi:hypothetical protein
VFVEPKFEGAQSAAPSDSELWGRPSADAEGL